MKIAVASQNRKQVTGHTGRCRRFWIYEVEAGRIVSRTLLELPIDQSFHAISPQAPHPLDSVQVLISGGMGEGLVTRLARMGIEGLITTENDPDRAVALFLAGNLPLGAPEASGDHRRLRHEGLA
jgi:predicted Fe-Mo cluster-binding NifX family protein